LAVLTLALLTVPLLAKEHGESETEPLAPNGEQNAARSSARTIEFAGRQWAVKSGCGLGPGPNCWSDSEQSVWVDGSGQLHLKIRNISGTWYSAEVYTMACTQYRMHRFSVIGPVDNLDKNVVAALFLYKDDWTEMDIEFARWGEANPTYNAQYVVQPSDTPGNREQFSMTLSISNTTHYIDWSGSAIRFKSIHGHYQELPDPAHLIHEWSYTGSDIPAEDECLQIHINLWLYQGNPPSDDQEVEIIVKNVQPPYEVYLPMVFKCYPPWITVTASGSRAWGTVGPSCFCNDNYKVALYAKTDIWYVQPVEAEPGRNVKIKSDCTWESFTNRWDQMAAHLVLASYDHPSEIHSTEYCPPPPLELDCKNVLAASCYPATYP
jgi:hypothetical protein